MPTNEAAKNTIWDWVIAAPIPSRNFCSKKVCRNRQSRPSVMARNVRCAMTPTNSATAGIAGRHSHRGHDRESWQMYSNISPPATHDDAVFSVIVHLPDHGLLYAPGSSMVNS